MRALRAFLGIVLLAVSFGAAAQIEGFDRLEKQLKLKPHQKEQFDKASAATQRALVSSALAALQLKEKLRDELSKNRPDVGALLAAQDAAFEQNRPLFREARDEWVRLYALLDDDQVAIAKSFIDEKLSKLPRF